MQYERRKKEALPVLAICYDFDKTLSPDDMQAQGYIQSVGFDTETFWAETNELSRRNDMDSNLSYMLKMVREAEGNLVLTRRALQDYGSRVKLYPGVTDWFSRVREFGKENGVIVEHYIISSGLKEMIEGTAIAGEFERIYASSFYYNSRGVAVWPAQVVNFTAKTQYLFRIEKGTLDINDPAVNEHFARSDYRVPFRNMVYIGDSETDIPCMSLVHHYGGHSIGVYDETRPGALEKMEQMKSENRIKYAVPCDYRSGSALDGLMKKIIIKTAAFEALENQASV